MLVQNCRKYLDITKVQLKLSTRNNFVLAIGILLILPVVFGVKNLDSITSTFVLERGVSLIGIVLLTPVFSSEQDKNISETVESKLTSMTSVYLIRLFLSLITIILLISVFVLFMKYNSCDFDDFKYIYGTFSSALFLGALGVLAYSISDNIVVGYLVSACYYIINYVGADKIKYFYLFSMSKTSFKEKYVLSISAVIIISISILYKYLIKKLR